MPTALIICAGRTGQTREIADLIAEGIRFSGGEVHVVNANQVKTDDDLQGYDAYILGSATYHGDMMQSMKTLLFLLEKIGLEGKVGGAFGAFGWSGEASDRIYDTMKHVFGMDMIDAPLRLNSALLPDGQKMARDYGREIGKKMTGR